MIEEPYRWLEAIGNRREYVREQLKGGSPAFAVSLPDGILLLGVGVGIPRCLSCLIATRSPDWDIRPTLKNPQVAIDTAHLEAFNRAPEDVSLRRLVVSGSARN